MVINVDAADPPWSRVADDGTFHGFEVDIATRLAASLGVEAEFTTYPLEQVVTGAVMFVLTYPVAWATDYTEEMEDTCYRWPVHQTFERPLGDLQH